MNIFKFLPLKDIARCRQVSSLWLAVIDHPAMHNMYVALFRKQHPFLAEVLCEGFSSGAWLRPLQYKDILIEMYEWARESDTLLSEWILELFRTRQAAETLPGTFHGYVEEVFKEAPNRALDFLHVLIMVYGVPYIFPPQVPERVNLLEYLMHPDTSAPCRHKTHGVYWYIISNQLTRFMYSIDAHVLCKFVTVHFAVIHWNVPLCERMGLEFFLTRPMLLPVLPPYYKRTYNLV